MISISFYERFSNDFRGIENELIYFHLILQAKFGDDHLCIFMHLCLLCGSSLWQLFLKIGVLKNFVAFTVKQLSWNLQNSPNLSPKETPTQVLSSEYCGILKNSLFHSGGFFWLWKTSMRDSETYSGLPQTSNMSFFSLVVN